MSQARQNNDKVNFFALCNKPKFKREKDKGKFFYHSRFQYCNTPFGLVQPHWNFFRWRRPPFKKKPNATPEKEPPRPPSPFSGTEEYTLKKIQETSDMIKKQLMMPPEASNSHVEKPEPVVPVCRSDEIMNEKKNDKCDGERTIVKNKKSVQYNVEEIHQKIISHITNLNHGKKMNLICSTSSGYDTVIQQIQKQKRLELSKVFRDMCSNQVVENRDVINSIIPDIGIKIEDLPLEVIQELSSTLDLNFEDTFLKSNDNETVKIKTEHCEKDEVMSNYPSLSNIKIENTCDEVNDLNECLMDPVENVDYNLSFSQNVNTAGQLNKTNSEGSQTDSINWKSVGTQTDLETNNQFQVNTSVDNLEDAIKSMLKIDEEITRLTELRQSMFVKLQTNSVITKKKQKDFNKTTEIQINKNKKQKNDNDLYRKELDFRNISEKILVMKVVKETLLAGTESGKVFCIDVKTGKTLNIIFVGIFPITSLCIWTTVKKRLHLFIGSLETCIKEYDFYKNSFTRLTNTGQSVQCMEQSWDCIFIGTVSGTLMRYSLKLHKIEFKEEISSDRILVLKATQEGARRVLLVGTRNLPVSVRDAMSGLHMRTMEGVVAPTVYSLLLENSLVYCGTTFHDILVFSFHDGNLVRKYQASNSKGIGCMKIVENLLFASCHNGNIYVYNTKTRQYIGQIEGPGGVILSMEVLKNIIIVGTMSFNFKSMLIPEYIVESNRSAFEL